MNKLERYKVLGYDEYILGKFNLLIKDTNAYMVYNDKVLSINSMISKSYKRWDGIAEFGITVGYGYLYVMPKNTSYVSSMLLIDCNGGLIECRTCIELSEATIFNDKHGNIYIIHSIYGKYYIKGKDIYLRNRGSHTVYIIDNLKYVIDDYIIDFENGMADNLIGLHLYNFLVFNKCIINGFSNDVDLEYELLKDNIIECDCDTTCIIINDTGYEIVVGKSSEITIYNKTECRCAYAKVVKVGEELTWFKSTVNGNLNNIKSFSLENYRICELTL